MGPGRTPRWRALGFVGAALIGLGGVAIFVAVLAGPLGLGLAEEFLPYGWFGIARRTLAQSGAGIGTVGAAALALGWFGPPGSRFAKNAGLVAASIFVGLLCIELVVRLIDGVPLWPPRNLVAERAALLTVQSLNEYHPVLGWVLKPNIAIGAGDPDGSFTTGEYGARMNSAEIRPLPRGAILAVGDSFTAGSEVGDRHSWPAHLERLLGEPVVNAATGGWAADQIVLRAEELIVRLDPHTVIVSFLFDDVARAGYRVYGGGNKPYFTIENGRLVVHNQPVPVFTGKPDEVGFSPLGYVHLASWTLERLGFGDWWRRQNTSYVRADNDPLAVSCLLLRRLKRETDRRGMSLLFVVQHFGDDRFAAYGPPELGTSVAACAREHGIDTLGTWEALAEINRADLGRYRRLFVMHDEGRLYGHMSSQGNAFIARLIAEKLRAADR